MPMTQISVGNRRRFRGKLGPDPSNAITVTFLAGLMAIIE
jgi:hypothetical protein